MIPKVIHYCWFGGNPLPDSALKCIRSWKQYCPDYEIIVWNEDSFDVNYNAYTKEAFDAKKWAFVSDVARLFALVHHGGIYMDTDVELLKPFDDLLHLEAFSGFESDNQIPTGIMAAKKGHPLFVQLLNDYEGEHFKNSDGSYNLTTNTVRITSFCLDHGLKLNNTRQEISGFVLFPKDFFCAKDYETGIVTTTENTYTIHHFSGSWISDENKEALRLKRVFSRLLSNRMAGYLGKFIAICKTRGVGQAIQEIQKRIQKNG